MTIPITKIPAGGVDLGALAASETELKAAEASDTIKWPSGASSIFLLAKTGATDTTITVTSRAAAGDGLARDDKEQTLGANKTWLFEISQAFRNDDDDDNEVTVAASGARTGVVLGAFYL